MPKILDPSEVKVFVTHHLGEAQVSDDSLRHHIKITGALPEVGKQLMYLPKGESLKMFAMPYGKVVRIEYE